MAPEFQQAGLPVEVDSKLIDRDRDPGAVGWALTRLGDVVRPSTEATEPSETPDARFIGLEHIESNTRKILGEGKASDVRSTKKTFLAGDILYGRLRPYLNKVCVTTFAGVCSTELLVMRCDDGIEARFIARVLSSQEFVKFATSQSSGLNLPRVKFSALARYEFALPPTLEQRRIIERLESLESRLQDARSALEGLPPLLERGWQSLLGSALRGEMTSEWRMKATRRRATLGEKRLRSRTSKLTNKANVVSGTAALSIGKIEERLPDTWMRRPLVEVARLESGHTPSREHPEYWGGNVSWISIPDARDHNGKEIAVTVSSITEDGLANSSARVLPKDTVCVSRTASIGYVVIMAKPMATSQDFANWVCSGQIVPKFLLYVFLAEGRNLARFGKGTTHTTIYYSELRALHLALPSPREQREIVRRLRLASARIEAVSQAQSKVIAEINSIAGSILSKALEGAIVPHRPDEEPASSLLERIRRERERNPPIRTKKRAKTTMKHATPESIATGAQQIQADCFSFDELRSVVTGSYEEVKAALFELLSARPAPFEQVFDTELRMMRFQKVK